MNQTNEEYIFQLMKHAEELQLIADETLKNTNRAISRMEQKSAEAILNAVQSCLNENLQETKTSLKEATLRLVEVSKSARETSVFLKRTGLMQGSFLVMLTLALIGIGFGLMQFLGQSKLQELAEVKALIQTEQANLNELKSKNWGLELRQNGDERAVILPKGVKILRSGKIKDGREAIVIN